MSRTIRRTKAKKTRSRFEKDYTHKRLDEWLDVLCGYQYRSNGVPFRPLEGKEFEIAYWKYHSDNGFAEFGFENAFERPNCGTNREQRAAYKVELNRWIQNPDHEVIFQRPKEIWDYY